MRVDGKSALQKNMEFSENYRQRTENAAVPDMAAMLLEKGGAQSIVDLGCGDGGIVSAIDRDFPGMKITGVDISPRRIRELGEKYPGYEFVCGDAAATALLPEKFDVAISTQVIEHLEDRGALLDEARRLLKRGGHLYISSVVKRQWAVYKYRNNGRFVLDPTHEHEYKSECEFLRALEARGFRVIRSRTSIVRRKLLGMDVPIPGFYIVEALCEKQEE